MLDTVQISRTEKLVDEHKNPVVQECLFQATETLQL
jgi:hypothetical protein